MNITLCQFYSTFIECNGACDNESILQNGSPPPHCRLTQPEKRPRAQHALDVFSLGPFLSVTSHLYFHQCVRAYKMQINYRCFLTFTSHVSYAAAHLAQSGGVPQIDCIKKKKKTSKSSLKSHKCQFRQLGKCVPRNIASMKETVPKFRSLMLKCATLSFIWTSPGFRFLLRA